VTGRPPISSLAPPARPSPRPEKSCRRRAGSRTCRQRQKPRGEVSSRPNRWRPSRMPPVPTRTPRRGCWNSPGRQVSENYRTSAPAQRPASATSRRVGAESMNVVICARGPTMRAPECCSCATTPKSSPGSWPASRPSVTNSLNVHAGRVGASPKRPTPPTRSSSSPAAPTGVPMGSRPGGPRSSPGLIFRHCSAAIPAETKRASSRATDRWRSRRSATSSTPKTHFSPRWSPRARRSSASPTSDGAPTSISRPRSSGSIRPAPLKAATASRSWKRSPRGLGENPHDDLRAARPVLSASPRSQDHEELGTCRRPRQRCFVPPDDPRHPRRAHGPPVAA
jgi:hypothetical protein